MSKISEKEENSQYRLLTSKGFSTSKAAKTVDSAAINEQMKKVREEAEKRYQRKLSEMIEGVQAGAYRVEEQKRKLEEKMELQKMKKATHIEFKNKNVERQHKKDEYKKEKLIKQQEQKEKMVQEFVQGKESLFSQSQYLKFANDLRKYHLKHELETGKQITIDKVMDINDKFKPKDFKPNPAVKREEVRKMVAHIMSRPIQSSAGRYVRCSRSSGNIEEMQTSRKFTENNNKMS